MKHKKFLRGAAMTILLGGIYVGANHFMEKYLEGDRNMLQWKIPSKINLKSLGNKINNLETVIQKFVKKEKYIDKAEEKIPNEKEIIYNLEAPSLKGKSLDDYFTEFEKLDEEQQKKLVKKLDNFGLWGFILLTRYVPVDGFLRNLSSFYSNDYKTHLKSLLSESILDPLAIGPTKDHGLGQITPSSEKWARRLYKKDYHFPGEKINKEIFDPYTNLVLSSIILRKAAEKNVLDFDALYSLYTNGFKGIRLNKDGYYETNRFGLNDTQRANRFNDFVDKFVVFSWLSMVRPDLKENLKDKGIKKLIEKNINGYDGEVAYREMVNSLRERSKRYSTEDKEVFDSEIKNVSTLIDTIYSKN